MSIRLKKFGSDANNKIFVRLDTDNLERIEAMLNKHYVAQIGVLGEKAQGRLEIKNEKVGGKSGNRKIPVVQGASSKSNADIGLIHEKGSPAHNIPRRSFLEVPLTTRMPKVMAKVGALLLKGVTEFNIEEAYKKLAAIGEGIVLQAFPTSGYGTWAPLGTGKLNKYGRHTIKETGPSHLIKSGQLRQSIASRVVTK
jgi:hypothetical protein